MKPKTSLCFLAAAFAAPVCSAAPIFSWETDTEGWGAGAPNSVATSATGATDGLQALAVTQPFAGTNNWWNVGSTVSLSAAQLQSIFTNATELKVDVSYPNPGYTSWWAGHHLELIIQGDNGVGWTGLASREIAVGGAPQTLTFPLTVAQAAGMASSGWGQIVLRFDFGNGGCSSPNAVFYVDNLTNTVVVDPSPATNLYWKGDVDDQWTSLNWTTDLAGTVAGGALPTDGSAGIAFAADGSAILNSVLGADQSVKSIVVTPGVSASIGGTHRLTVGADGIWLDETAAGLMIDNSGGVMLGASQVWRNKSTSSLIVDSVIGGSGTLTKSGSGPVRLGGANNHTGGTLVEQGALALDHADALGGPAASLTMNGGSLDLNGLNVTLGSLSGLVGGVIHNTSFTPSTFTLDVASDSAYTCQLNDATGGASVSLVKKGLATVTSNGGGNFTGPVVIEDGLFVANFWVFNVPNFSSFGNSQVDGRTITVTAPGTLSFINTNIFGNAMADTSLLPAIIVNESSLDSTRYNQIGDITLKGAILSQSSTDTGNYLGYQFKGDITITGTSPSDIQSNNGKANHLSSDTVFNVADVTGNVDVDLVVSCPLTNQSGDFGNADGSLSKSGPGMMALDGFNTYSGATKVLEGVLSLGTSTLSDSAGVVIEAGAMLNLAHFETDTVAALTIGAATMPDGIYGAMGSGAQFPRPEITGDGMLLVFSDPYLPWIASFATLSGQTAAKGADPDKDGLTNFEEFALDGNPEDGTATGKVRSRVETVGDDEALVITLPVRNGGSFTGTAPAFATVAADKVNYEIGGSNDLVAFDQNVFEVDPALTGTPDMPGLNTGWTYRTFRLDGAVGGDTPRGPKGFLRATVTEAP